MKIHETLPMQAQSIALWRWWDGAEHGREESPLELYLTVTSCVSSVYGMNLPMPFDQSEKQSKLRYESVRLGVASLEGSWGRHC